MTRAFFQIGLKSNPELCFHRFSFNLDKFHTCDHQEHHHWSQCHHWSTLSLKHVCQCCGECCATANHPANQSYHQYGHYDVESRIIDMNLRHLGKISPPGLMSVEVEHKYKLSDDKEWRTENCQVEVNEKDVQMTSLSGENQTKTHTEGADTDYKMKNDIIL